MFKTDIQSILTERLEVDDYIEVINVLKKHNVIDVIDENVNKTINHAIEGIYTRIGQQIAKDKEIIKKYV